MLHREGDGSMALVPQTIDLNTQDGLAVVVVVVVVVVMTCSQGLPADNDRAESCLSV